MSAVAALLIGLSVLLIWSGLTGQALFIGNGAVVGSVLRGEKK